MLTGARSAQAMTVLLAGSGVLHFARPAFFDAMVPRVLPGAARTWTHASGVAELAVAGALAVPASRRLGGLAASGLFVAVLPANVQMALDARRSGKRGMFFATVLRLPLQIPLVLAGRRIFRG